MFWFFLGLGMIWVGGIVSIFDGLTAFICILSGAIICVCEIWKWHRGIY